MAGTFTLSLDVEMAWGSWRATDPAWEAVRREPEMVERIDSLCRQFDISATWAVVGAIEGLDPVDLEAHLGTEPVARALAPDINLAEPVPTVAAIKRDPAAWVAPGMTDVLVRSDARHELASHTYFHAVPASAQDMALDFALVRRAIPAVRETFIFPRDRVDPALLTVAPIRCFRGTIERPWFREHGKANGMGRIAHTIEQVVGWPAPLGAVRPGHPVAITSSTFFTLRRGLRRRIPASSIRARMRRTLDRAASDGGLFHLWSHPWNFAIDGSDALELLGETFEVVANRRDRGDIEVLTMGEVAAR